MQGYRLLEDFRVVGAGLSEWTFAERDGRIYFIKRFLAPTYPDDDAPGSAKTKARKRARCAAFEAHHRGIQAAMAPLTSYGGNLIATLDFFRHGAKYYKVTEKVDLAGLEPRDVAALGFPAQLVLLKTVAHSLKILHDLDIVHSDLKPSNVLIKRTELGYTTKLIDFDSSYVVGNPPPPEEIVGTMNYYSPELVSYIQGTGNARRPHPGLRHLRARPDLCRVPHRRTAGLRPGPPRSGDRGAQRRHAPPPAEQRAGTRRRAGRADAPGGPAGAPDGRPRSTPRSWVCAASHPRSAARPSPPVHRPPCARPGPPRTPIARWRPLPRRHVVPRCGAGGYGSARSRFRPAAGLPRPRAAAAEEPTPDRGRALLGKLIRKIEERRPR